MLCRHCSPRYPQHLLVRQFLLFFLNKKGYLPGKWTTAQTVPGNCSAERHTGSNRYPATSWVFWYVLDGRGRRLMQLKIKQCNTSRFLNGTIAYAQDGVSAAT